MEHQGIPNVHEVIAQHFRKPHALEDNLKFITQGKTCYIQSNVMLSLSLMISYIKHHQYSAKSKYFGPFYYIQIDPQDYDEWRTTPPEEEIHFSVPNDEDEHQNLSSDDNQVIQQENVCSEPPEPLSYSLFQSHFQGSSTSNTQKIFLPKPIWEKPSKDQQQMIIDHNRSLPKGDSPHLSTPNKSPSPLLHRPTPQQTVKSQQVHTHQSDESTTDTIKTETTPSDPLLAMVHQSIHTSDDDASDISNVLSVKRSPQIQVCQHYLFQHANHTNQQLVDHGTNGGLAGSDMHVIHRTNRKINIQGIDNHEVTGLDVVTDATLLNTSQGKVIGIFNEYAYLGKGSSIHSSGQLEWFKTNVDEKSVKVGGSQLITTLDGYSVPLIIKDGLAYATSIGRPTDLDMDTYPHVFFTSPDEWDPSVLDHDPPHPDGLDPSQVPDQPFGDPMFDACGDFNKHIISNLNTLLDAPPGDCGSYTEISSVFTANLHQSSPQEPDWNALCPFFACTSPSSIKDTFNVTTRHGTAPHIQDYQSEPYHQHHNKAENHLGLGKLYTNTIMNTSGSPACCWLLFLQYICVVLNHLASPILQGICPVQALAGTTPDISFMLHFHFMSLSTTGLILLSLISTFLHHLMERRVIGSVLPTTQVTVSPGGSSLRILKRSSFVLAFEVPSELQQTSVLHHLQGRGPHFLFPFLIPNKPKNSLPLDPFDESTPTFEQFVNSQSGEDEDNPIHMANIDIPNLLGRSFLLPPKDNGEHHMANIIDIDDHGQPLEDIKFKLKINKDQAEEIMSYNQLMDYIQKGTDAEEDPDSLFKFRDIVAHQGPLESSDPNHKGSKYNVMVEWESGEVTYEPLALISKDDPITCSVYAKKHDLLDTTGWKHLK